MILLDKLLCSTSNRNEFGTKVEKIASALNVEPAWIMIMMYLESRLNPQAVNKQASDDADPYKRSATRATGLIQFMPSTAKGLGTSTQSLYKMNAIQQLDYVYKYFKPYTNKLHCFSDMYLVCFFPAALGKPDDWVLQTSKLSAYAIANQNPGIDLNKDGKITVGEFKQSNLKRVPQEYLNYLIEKKTLPSPQQTCCSSPPEPFASTS